MAFFPRNYKNCQWLRPQWHSPDGSHTPDSRLWYVWDISASLKGCEINAFSNKNFSFRYKIPPLQNLDCVPDWKWVGLYLWKFYRTNSCYYIRPIKLRNCLREQVVFFNFILLSLIHSRIRADQQARLNSIYMRGSRKAVEKLVN